MISHHWGMEPIDLPMRRTKFAPNGKAIFDTEGHLVHQHVKPVEATQRLLAHKFFGEWISSLSVNMNGCQIVVTVPVHTDDQTADRQTVRRLAEAVWFGDPETGL